MALLAKGIDLLEKLETNAYTGSPSIFLLRHDCLARLGKDAYSKLSQHRDVLSELVRYKQSGRANQKMVGLLFFWFRFLWQFKENELAKGETPTIERLERLVF